MHVGHGCYIADKWIPKDTPTGLEDINGVEIRTGTTVNLRGCTSTTAIVGIWHDQFVLYFGGDNGSVMWYLNSATILEHKVEVIK